MEQFLARQDRAGETIIIEPEHPHRVVCYGLAAALLVASWFILPLWGISDAIRFETWIAVYLYALWFLPWALYRVCCELSLPEGRSGSRNPRRGKGEQTAGRSIIGITCLFFVVQDMDFQYPLLPLLLLGLLFSVTCIVASEGCREGASAGKHPTYGAAGVDVPTPCEPPASAENQRPPAPDDEGWP